jgi:peptidoglycan/xylan/chitin deacetylase (PgdA/CDA1 family)
VPVLCYHKVDNIPVDARFRCNYVRPEQFAAQLWFLRRAGFESLTASEYAAYRRGEKTIAGRPIILTFDDGYASNYDIAVPLLERYGFRATFFVVSDYIGGTNCWDRDERQERLLSRDQLLDMHKRGFEIQSHTRTHPRLPDLSAAQMREEISGSRAVLENLLQSPVRVIAYPWGDYDETTLQIARQSGYEAGMILRRRINFDRTPRLALRRIGVNCETSLSRLAWDLLRLRWRGA